MPSVAYGQRRTQQQLTGFELQFSGLSSALQGFNRVMNKANASAQQSFAAENTIVCHAV
jgi:hypothetical protein